MTFQSNRLVQINLHFTRDLYFTGGYSILVSTYLSRQFFLRIYRTKPTKHINYPILKI